jgi:hypothetical protein
VRNIYGYYIANKLALEASAARKQAREEMKDYPPHRYPASTVGDGGLAAGLNLARLHSGCQRRQSEAAQEEGD